MDKFYRVNEKTLTAILSYLNSRPYSEVATLIKAIVEGSEEIKTENKKEKKLGKEKEKKTNEPKIKAVT